MKPFQKIERELREAHIYGLQIALEIVEEHATIHGASAATEAAAEEIARLIAQLEDEQRGAKLM